MINIHNKANLVPDVTVSFSQIPTIPKDCLSLSLSLSNIHTKKSTMITAAILSYFFFKVTHCISDKYECSSDNIYTDQLTEIALKCQICIAVSWGRKTVFH